MFTSFSPQYAYRVIIESVGTEMKIKCDEKMKNMLIAIECLLTFANFEL